MPQRVSTLLFRYLGVDIFLGWVFGERSGLYSPGWGKGCSLATFGSRCRALARRELDPGGAAKRHWLGKPTLDGRDAPIFAAVYN